MEISYTNFELDTQIYGTNELIGLIDKSGDFIYENFYDVRPITYNDNLSVALYLKNMPFYKNKKKLTFDMLDEFGITKELQKRSLKKLSTSELLKVLIIKLCSSDAKTIILDSIDSYLSYGDLNAILKTLKNHLPEIKKNVIFMTNKVDNIIQYSSRYIIVEEGKIIYNGNDFKKLPIESSIANFVRLANQKGAALENYKDVNDLLKAIYRSVKR